MQNPHSDCEASASLNRKWNVFTVFSQTIEQVEAFKARVNLSTRVLAGVEFRNFGVRSTPTALLVGKTGVIDRVWIGTSPAIEADILAAVQR